MKRVLSLLLVSGALHGAAAAPQTLKLTSKDKKEFTVDRAVAIASSGLIKTVLENDDRADEVPIPGVTGVVLAKLVMILQFISSEDALEITMRRLPNNMLLDLLQAANYMDIPSLLQPLAQQVVQRLKEQIDAPSSWPLDLQIVPLTAAQQKEGVPSVAEVQKLPKVLREIIAQQFFLGWALDIDKLLGVKTYTPYEQLVQYQFIPAELLKYFPNLKNNPNGISKELYGRTALTSTHIANNPARLVRGLLRLKGIDVNMQNQVKGDFETPLIAAVSFGRIGISADLLRAGANPNLPDGRGRTPLWCAEHYQHLSEQIKLLKKAGAKK